MAYCAFEVFSIINFMKLSLFERRRIKSEKKSTEKTSTLLSKQDFLNIKFSVKLNIKIECMKV